MPSLEENEVADAAQVDDKTVADRMQRYRQRGSNIVIPPYPMSDRRVACASDPILHLQTYHPHWFTAPFSKDQTDSIFDMEKLCREGFDFFDVEPRGWGKTTRAKGMVIRAILHGFQFYIPLVGATATQAKKLCLEVEQELADNDILAEDWPDICLPIRAAFAKPNRSRYLHINHKPARLECSTTKLVLPAVRCCDDGPDIYNSVFECAGLQEACRGLRHTTAKGKILRPGVVLIDDFQTDKSARSANQCALRINLIQNAFKRMGGFNKKVRVGIIATVIVPNDAADQLLDREKHPSLHGVRKKFVYEWPVHSRYGMEQRKIQFDAALDLWGKYVDLRKQSKREGGNGEPANDFYAEHRVEMDDGARVGWEHGFDASEGELSTIQSAFNIIADDGEASFFAECQNEPIKVTSVNVKLTADNVMARVNGTTMGEAPPDTHHLTGFIDPNDHALAWAVGAFRRDLTGSIIAYDEWARGGNIGPAHIGEKNRRDRIWDETHPAPEGKQQAFWNALCALADWLFLPGRFTRNNEIVRLDLVLLDKGYTFTEGDRTIVNWCHAWTRPPINGYGVMPSRGWAANRFSLRTDPRMVRRSLEAWWRVDQDEHLPEVKTLHHDAGFHRRQMQQAWLLAPGSPGSLSINGTHGIAHLKFAQQIAGEKLLDYSPGDRGGTSGMYHWATTPGIANEMVDCVTGCRLAAWTLIGDSAGVSILGRATGTMPITHAAILGNNAPVPAPSTQSDNVAPVPPMSPGPVIPPEDTGFYNWGRR